MTLHHSLLPAGASKDDSASHRDFARTQAAAALALALVTAVLVLVCPWALASGWAALLNGARQRRREAKRSNAAGGSAGSGGDKLPASADPVRVDAADTYLGPARQVIAALLCALTFGDLWWASRSMVRAHFVHDAKDRAHRACVRWASPKSATSDRACQRRSSSHCGRCAPYRHVSGSALRHFLRAPQLVGTGRFIAHRDLRVENYGAAFALAHFGGYDIFPSAAYNAAVSAQGSVHGVDDKVHCQT